MLILRYHAALMPRAMRAMRAMRADDDKALCLRMMMRAAAVTRYACAHARSCCGKE